MLAEDPEIAVVGAVGDGRLALLAIPELKPDLVTLDVEMPGMDGIQTLIEIRKLNPRLPVIMFSTLTGPGAAQDRRGAGARSQRLCAEALTDGQPGKCTHLRAR